MPGSCCGWHGPVGENGLQKKIGPGFKAVSSESKTSVGVPPGDPKVGWRSRNTCPFCTCLNDVLPMAPYSRCEPPSNASGEPGAEPAAMGPRVLLVAPTSVRG